MHVRVFFWYFQPVVLNFFRYREMNCHGKSLNKTKHFKNEWIDDRQRQKKHGRFMEITNYEG